MERKKGYLLVTALVLVAAVAIFVAAMMDFVSNTSSLRVSKEKLFMASNASMNGVQMGTSYVAHFANSIGGFDLNFDGVGSVPFNSVPWLQSNTSNNYFNSIYSSIDGKAWKSALSTLATDSNVLWLNKIPQVEGLFVSLQASGILKVIPDVVVIQTKIPNTNIKSKYKYFIVARAVVGGKVSYSSGFVVANFLNKYLYFTQEEPPYSSPYYNVTFMTGDTLDGPIRTNSTLVTLGTPDFKGRVEYGGLYKIPGYGSPNFESGSSVLSSSDINAMNISKIASDYSTQIDSEVSLPSVIKSAGVTSTPIGLDLSVVYDNLLKNWNNYGFDQEGNKGNGNWGDGKYKWIKNGYYTLQRLTNMFKENFDNWLWWNNYTFNQLPKVIQNDYSNVITSIQGIPSLRISFSKGQGSNSGPTVTVEYAIDTTNAVNAVKHLQEDVNIYGLSPYYPNWYSNYYTSFYDVLQNYSGPNWQELLTINPKPGNTVPGISQLVINGNTAASLLGLKSSNTFDFNFNGVIKTTSDLVIGGGGSNGGQTTSIVSGKYTVYTTRNTYIKGSIVYDYANQALGKNSSWISSPISSSDVAKIRNATGTDFLNIVSNYDIALTNTPQYPKIMSSLYSFNGTFWYPDFENATWDGDPGQMFVYGSMMQYEGGQLFGTYFGGKLVSGYHAYYGFDWRILNGLPANMYGTPSAKEKAILLSVRTVY